jgi:hypothetical protein
VVAFNVHWDATSANRRRKAAALSPPAVGLKMMQIFTAI